MIKLLFLFCVLFFHKTIAQTSNFSASNNRIGNLITTNYNIIEIIFKPVK
jgi:hypothetical protein